MNIIVQYAAIMATPVVLVSDNNETDNAAASQCCHVGFSMLLIERDKYNKHIKRNSLHNPCEKTIEPGSNAKTNGVIELTNMLLVFTYSHAPMATKPNSNRLTEI